MNKILKLQTIIFTISITSHLFGMTRVLSQTSLAATGLGSQQQAKAEVVIDSETRNAVIKNIVSLIDPKIRGGLQLKKLMHHYYRLALIKGIKVGESFEIEGVTFKRLANGLEISILYYASEEKRNPTQSGTARYAFAEILGHCQRPVNVLQESMAKKQSAAAYFETLEKEIDKKFNSFLEAANSIHIANPMCCEKSYSSIHDIDRTCYARYRKLALSRLLGLLETQYKIECLICEFGYDAPTFEALILTEAQQ